MKTTLFFTGCPGSRWSGVAQQLGKMRNVNHSDEAPGRHFEKNAVHSAFSGHKGSYFGPGMEFGAGFARLPTLGRKEIEREIDRAFAERLPGQLRIVKGHIFSYHLDHLRKLFPESPLMMVWRDSEESFRWWMELGGFSIPYPRYDWYVDEATMRRRVDEENRNIEVFAGRHRLRLEPFTPDWVQGRFGERVDFDAAAYFTGVKVALLR